MHKSTAAGHNCEQASMSDENIQKLGDIVYELVPGDIYPARRRSCKGAGISRIMAVLGVPAEAVCSDCEGAGSVPRYRYRVGGIVKHREGRGSD